MTDTSQNKLVVNHLYKIFGDQPERAFTLLEQGQDKDTIFKETGLTIGVQDTSFSVQAGEIFVVMGLSGSGKSTLVRMLNRLIKPTRGSIFIDGEPIHDAPAEAVRDIRLRKLSMVFQHFALFPHMTVAENVAYGLKIQGMAAGERRERAMRSLAKVGLDARADSAPTALSGGMQQRVGLARALAADPDVLLMDEPFSALDPLIRRDMQQELLELQRDMHKTIVFITHDLNEALFLGDRIAIMKEGRFVQIGSPGEIVAEPADDYVAAFTRDVDRSRVFTVSQVMDEPRALDLDTDTPASALERMDALDVDALHVLRNGRVAGVVTRSDARSRSTDDSLYAILHTDYPVVAQDTLLYRAYPDFAADLPLAVVDAEERLAGVVNPRRVFARLSAGGSSGAREHAAGAA